MSTNLNLLPLLTEKSYKISKDCVFVFTVPKSTNKISIKQQIETYFNVKVKAVNLTNIKGKTKRTVSLSGKRYANSVGSRSNVKKAYVYLNEGFTLPFFDSIEEENKNEEKAQENFDKAAEKSAKPKKSILKLKKEDKK